MSRWLLIAMLGCTSAPPEDDNPPGTTSTSSGATTTTGSTTSTTGSTTSTTGSTTSTDTATTDTGTPTGSTTTSTTPDTASDSSDSAPQNDSAHTGDTGWTSPPCLCDDGLFCNGVETCDADGVCVDGVPPEPEDDGDPCTRPTACDEDSDTWGTEPDTTLPACAPPAPVPTADPLDYAFRYWPANHRPTETWPAVLTEHHLMTGYYGAVFDEAIGSMIRLGPLTDGLPAVDALERSAGAIESLPELNTWFDATAGDVTARATAFLGAADTTIDRARMVDGGRFMNRLKVPNLRYEASDDLHGVLHISSMSRHMVLTHEASGTDAVERSAQIVLDGDAIASLTETTWWVPGRAVELTDGTGEGWLFVVYDAPDSTTALALTDEGALVAKRAQDATTTTSISLLMAPTAALTDGLRALYLNPSDGVTVHSTLLNLAGAPVGEPSEATWDEQLGAYRVDLRPLQDTGAPGGPNYEDPTFHHWHGRHRIELTSAAETPVSAPLAFFGSDQISWYITGGIPQLRDSNGEPTGVPLQISKNWHKGRPNNWYHLYSQPTVAPGSSHTLELTMASSMWGDVFAASHAQLCLAGWSNTQGGHWDESALGAFGESITYDPDLTLGRSMQDDVRPLLVDANGRWNWTGNVGGAEFLRYATLREPYWIRRVARVRSHYESPGPNLTDVTYSGLTSDGRIRVDASPRLVASDDMVRSFIELSFRFVEDVEYSRLAFFQMAADNYSDNGFTRHAWGNSDGVVVDQDMTTTGTVGYAGVRGVPLEGDEPWVFMYTNTRVDESLPEEFGNLGFVVREFEANVGGTILTTPHMSLYETFNGGESQLSFELSLPYEDGAPWCGDACEGGTAFIPAGSTVHATIEYVVPPSSKVAYYGPSAWLDAFPAASWDAPDMMWSLARDGALNVVAEIGTLQSVYPTRLSAAEGSVAAEWTVEGGLGFRPFTVEGLIRHDGWRLQRAEDDAWVDVDASSDVGNDYWQATQDAATGTWSVTHSVPMGEAQRLRLVWRGEE